LKLNRSARLFSAVLTLLFASALHAQGPWVKPAATPNTDVKCTSCPGKANGLLTPGYPLPLSHFIGRFLDSTATNDFQQPFRTARARQVWPVESSNRLYFTIGSSVFAYDTASFLQRLQSGEGLSSVRIVPVAGKYGWTYGSRISSFDEQIFRFDQFFYAENEDGNGWTYQITDGQDRLYWVDVDDRNLVYLAYTLYGWGIVKDDLRTDGALMTSVYQRPAEAEQSDEVQPNQIAVIKGSNGSYYAIVGDRSQFFVNVFDVTDPAHPVKKANVGHSMMSFAKSTNRDRIAITTRDGNLEIYTSDAFVNGRAPLYTASGLGNAQIHAVASDGANFYAAIDGPTLSIATFTPNASGSYDRADVTTSRWSSSTSNLRYGGGYLVQAGVTNSAADLRVFKVTNGLPQEVPFSDASGTSYFQRYYIFPASSAYTAPGFGTFYDSGVIRSGGKSYMIVTGGALGDVYELQSSATLSVTVQGAAGHANPNAPPANKIFYGDPVSFLAATTTASPVSVYWDFGNSEAVAGADPNSVGGVTGSQATHRYSGVTAPSQLPATRVVTAVSVTDSSNSATAYVTLAKPAARVNVGTTAIQSAPIVVGDVFTDASDGTMESHFDTYVIDGMTTKALPSDTVPVGTCGAHTLDFDAHYGPYTGSGPGLTSLSDLPIGVHGVSYSVLPFAATISMTPQTATLVFNASVRVSADGSVVTASQAAALQYVWEVVDASNHVVSTGPSGTGVTNVPPMTVAKSALSGRGLRAHLVITSATAIGGGCAGRGFEKAEAFSQALNAPDPVINGGCTNGAPPCSFGVASQSGIDTVADGWTYSWSIQPSTGVSSSSNSGSTFAPSFFNPGTYTVSVSVTNAVATKTVTTNVTYNGIPCQTMTDGNVFIYFTNAANTCSPVGGTCAANEAISFYASTFGYDFACASHTFTWDFGDGTTGTGQSPTHVYAASGNYTVHMTASNPQQTRTFTAVVNVNGSNGCPSMVAGNNVFISYTGPSSNCSGTSPNHTPCSASETINFTAGALNYNYSCSTHTFAWDFGDGAKATTTSLMTTHAYTAAGVFTVSLTITTPNDTATMTTNVTVTGGPCQTIIPGTNVFVSYAGTPAPAGSDCNGTNGVDCFTSETITFDVHAFPPYDFACAAHSFSWDFGDQTPHPSGMEVTHVFAGAGTYAVKLSVTVAGGATTVIPQTVKVAEKSGGGKESFPFDFTFEARSVNGILLPSEYVFTAFANDGKTTATTYLWDFGDGQATTGAAVQTHKFTEAGKHTITLKVQGFAGRVAHDLVIARHRPARH